jgi:hypothetical protein
MVGMAAYEDVHGTWPKNTAKKGGAEFGSA